MFWEGCQCGLRRQRHTRRAAANLFGAIFFLLTLWEPTWVTVFAVMIDLLCSTYLVCRSWMKYYGVMPHLNSGYCIVQRSPCFDFSCGSEGKKMRII